METNNDATPGPTCVASAIRVDHHRLELNSILNLHFFGFTIEHLQLSCKPQSLRTNRKIHSGDHQGYSCQDGVGGDDDSVSNSSLVLA
jgi:hypothetical protein